MTAAATRTLKKRTLKKKKISARRNIAPKTAKTTIRRADNKPTSPPTRSTNGKPRSFRDILSHLTYLQACKLLGPEGKQILYAGSKFEIDLEANVRIRSEEFQLRFPDEAQGRDVVASIAYDPTRPGRLDFRCSHCDENCAHVGAAFSTILEEKLALGLAAPPKERTPVESLAEEELVRRALDERLERAKKEKFRVKSTDPKTPWTDYEVTSVLSGKTYRVALRGEERGDSFCSCPDFRTNTLGTCKHVMHLLRRVKKQFPPAARKKSYRNRDIFVHLLYGAERTLHLVLPDRADEEIAQTVGRLAEGPIDDVHALVRCISKLERLGHQVTVYPDAEESIENRLFQDRIAEKVAEIRRDPATHPLRTSLLEAELLPYQLDGIAFAVGAGRAILADDMGLGKTIQGIGVAELLAREAEIRRVLIVCPTSLKSQWRNEIRRFSDRDAQLVVGRADDRTKQYESDRFFTICNYEQVLRDIMPIERAGWDLIILDEGQRIKNWESKTARIIKGLKSRFALVLSGTPLENRLDELYSVVQFIDDRRLPPAFRFFNRHRITDERGKVLGYKNLDVLRQNIRPILLRRTRQSVLQDLPPRTTEIVRIPPSDEQLEVHAANMKIVASVVRKAFISEMDLLRLQKHLLMCRLAANSTFLVDKKPPGFSTKLAHLDELLDQLFDEADRKVVLFSEWTRMLDLIEPLLTKRKLDFVRLDGSVPQKHRQGLVTQFQENGHCRLFITTNAGSTGLNLQAANTVLNIDLPWNPAVLEQRIARAHRMGQERPVQVFALVTEATIEENLLGTLATKQDLALAALDPESDVSQVEFHSGMEELKRRLEVLLGKPPEAPVDESRRDHVADETERLAHRERVAAAGGELLGAVFQFVDRLVVPGAAPSPAEPLVSGIRDRLSECIQEDASGRPQLTFTLPDRQSLDHMAQTLARLLAAGQGGGSNG